MFSKIKIRIFSACLSLFASLLAVPALWGDGGAYFVAWARADQLRAAVWQLGALVPPAPNQPYAVRSLFVEDVPGLQPTTIILGFDEPLDPWPTEITLKIQAESGQPPLIFTMGDKRPFGGPNLRFSGLSPEGYTGEAPPELFLKILTRVNERLLAGRPTVEPPRWESRGEGLEAARANLLYGVRQGPGDLYLLRVDPARYAFRPYHEKNFPNEGPVDMAGWAKRLFEAPALINGGQYYPDRAYMGLLRRGGADLSAGLHKGWKGFLVSEPGEGAPPDAPPAALIDLETHQEAWLPEQYKNVMQSFMILDRLGRLRVRESRNLAGRSAIGQDEEGRLLLIMTPAAITLYDFALALKNSGLGLTEVMGLDGGFEAQLMLRKDQAPFVAGSHFSISEKRALFLPGYAPTLPAVLAVEPIIY